LFFAEFSTVSIAHPRGAILSYSSCRALHEIVSDESVLVRQLRGPHFRTCPW
jgi:hypothetical protein